MDVDLSQLDCFGAGPTLDRVHTLYVFLGNGGAGTVYLDNVCAE